jgi:hypothetical protein
MASLALVKNSTFSNLGLRAVQDGRQKMPVVFTAMKNKPSNVLSLRTEAAYIISGVSSMAFTKAIGKVKPSASAEQPKTEQAIFRR